MLNVSYEDPQGRKEIAEDFISRMQAPPEDDFSAILGGKPAWLKYGGPCLLLLVVAAVLAFLLAPAGETSAEAALPVLSKSQRDAPPPAKIVVPGEVSPAPAKAAAIRSRPHKVARVDPKRAKVARKLVSKGWNRYKVARYHAASVSFGRAVHKAPGSTKGYYGLALSLFEQGFEQAALKVIRTGLRKKGAKAELWLLAGAIHQWIGEEDEARTMYRRYLKVKPDSAFAKDVRRLLAMDSLPAQFAE